MVLALLSFQKDLLMCVLSGNQEYLLVTGMVFWVRRQPGEETQFTIWLSMSFFCFRNQEPLFGALETEVNTTEI